MSGLHVAEEVGSNEKQYGDLGAMLPKLLHGADEIVQGESMPLFRSADLLIRNSSFTSPDAIAELLVNDRIEVLPNASYMIKNYKIIPVRLTESGEYFLLHAPDNGEGQLQDVNNLGMNLPEHFDYVARNVRLEHVNLVVCTHSHFQDIFSFIHDTQKARNFISAFDGDDGAIRQLVEGILASLRRAGASDFHVKPMVGVALLKMRLHGLLQPVPGSVTRVTLKVAGKIAQVLTQNTGGGLKPGQSYGGSFRYVASDVVSAADEGLGKLIATQNPVLQGTDYRLSIVPTRANNYSTVVRLLRKPGALKTLKDLGYDDSEIFLSAARIGTGVTILSGPTGSGKTTSLYAMLSEAYDPSLNTHTLEDPIEITLDGIVQTEVNSNYTTVNALRDTLRQDPDRIMVGEIRDSETAKLATDAANTGHAVITTLHANSAADCVRRLMRLGVDALDISSTIKYLIAQRLVEQLDNENSYVEYYDATEELIELFGEQVEGPVWLRRTLQPGGVIGRIPVYECIPMSAGIIDAIETHGDQISSTKIEEIALQEGFMPMEIYGLKKVLEGKTSVKSLTRYMDVGRMRRFKNLAIPLIRAMALREKPTE